MRDPEVGSRIHNAAMSDEALREQLVRVLDWEEAHVGFDKALADLPPDKRGALAPGFEHSVWQLLEHMRIAQEDILDFCVNPKYVHTMKWPDDYWPQHPAPPNSHAWDESVGSFTRERERFKKLARETKDLYALVPTGKGHQTYLRGILLLVDHNTYHLGQIVAVRRAVGAWA
jgi:uncharacterized damage-inducible protein DinB